MVDLVAKEQPLQHGNDRTRLGDNDVEDHDVNILNFAAGKMVECAVEGEIKDGNEYSNYINEATKQVKPWGNR